MKKRIEIKKISDTFFRVLKDDDFRFVMVLSYGLYTKYIDILNVKFKQEVYSNNLTFINLFEKIMTEDDYVILTDLEMIILSHWMSNTCNILLESDGVDFGNEYILKYFRIVQNFIKDIKTHTSHLEAAE